MGTEELPSRSRKWRIFAIALFIAAPLSLYVSTLIMQAYSARQASKMLDALEALRVGDPASSLERAVPECKIESIVSDDGCEMFAGWGRWQWQFMSRLPSATDVRRVEFLRRAGIQPWYVRVSSSVREGCIREIRVFAMVVGRGKSLGAEWQIAESMPSRFKDPNPGPDEKRTSIGGFSVTSLPGGCGIEVAVTPGSTPQELQARHVNRACFLPFSGCNELSKLLPDAVSVLDEHGQKWIDCHGVPQ